MVMFARAEQLKPQRPVHRSRPRRSPGGGHRAVLGERMPKLQPVANQGWLIYSREIQQKWRVVYCNAFLIAVLKMTDVTRWFSCVGCESGLSINRSIHMSKSVMYPNLMVFISIPNIRSFFGIVPWRTSMDIAGLVLCTRGCFSSSTV